MGTEVLRPRDCFIDLIITPPVTALAFSRRRSYVNNHNYNYNYNHCHVSSSVKPSRKPVARPDLKKRIEKKPSSDDSKTARSCTITTEKVTILRRGASLDSKIKSEALKKEDDAQMLGPGPGLIRKHIRVMDGIPGCDVYAGSAFAMSPSPTALPLPSFHKKSSSSPAVIDNSATRDLRRLLRLE